MTATRPSGLARGRSTAPLHAVLLPDRGLPGSPTKAAAHTTSQLIAEPVTGASVVTTHATDCVHIQDAASGKTSPGE